jgi:O-succinylbenzoate synthase
MKLDRIELREIRLPLREPFRISSGETVERRILLLELTDADGAAVWAECVAGEKPNYSAETLDTAWLALREWFAPRLLGVEVADPGAAGGLLARGIRGHRMARAALEMGLWNLAAVRAGRPLAALLGGSRPRIAVGISLGIQRSPDALVERAAAALEQGYRRIKLKIQPGADLDYVRAVRGALGADAPLMVDANNAYTLADAPVLRELDELGLQMIEQPLEHEDLLRHAELQRQLRTPLCLDESITSVARAEDMIALDAGRIINIKPGRLGGFAESLRVHDLCARHGVPVWCGGMLESGVGRGYNVALAALPNFTLPGDLSPSARYWVRDVVAPAWTMQDGTLAVPEHPGIGVDVDVDYIAHLTTRSETLRAGVQA